MSTTVFVSGATGFIAQHIVVDLLAKGYKVVGSVRSAAKGDDLKANLKSDNFSYEIVKDIAAPNAFDEALKNHPEVSVFLHTASPFHFNATDFEKEILDPAINGTKNALSSIKAHGPNVKNVVVTSSYASVMGSPDKPQTEASFNPITYEQSTANGFAAYIGSKKLAEVAAWDFYKQEKPNFVLNTVNPSYVFGPQAFTSGIKDSLNTSSEIINGLLKLTPDQEIPPTAAYFIDVRDVSKAHIHAFESDTKDFRYILTSSKFSNQDIVAVINKNFPELNLPKGKIGGDPAVDSLDEVDFSATLSKLGKYYTLEESVVDSVKQILEARK